MRIGRSPNLALHPVVPNATGQAVCVPIYRGSTVIGWGNADVIAIRAPGHGLPDADPTNDAHVIVRITALGGPWTGVEAVYRRENLAGPIRTPFMIPMSRITLTPDPQPTRSSGAGGPAASVSDGERAARAALSWLCEPADPALRALLARHEPVEVLDLLTVDGVPFALRREVREVPRSRLRQQAAAAVEVARNGGVRVVIPQDPQWPTGLRDLDAEPVCLWALGAAPIPVQARAVSIVGSRASTSYGDHVAAQLAGDLAGRSFTVVSSGAYGIEGSALRGALAAGGQAVAVLPTGLDRPHPRHHAALFQELARTGLLLTACPPGATVARTRFLGNQALLAALSAGTVVVEASLRATALIAARHAVALGRVAMAVPGPVTSATSAGCHHLLRTHPQTRLVTDAADVLDALGDLTPNPERPEPAPHPGPRPEPNQPTDFS